MIKSIGRNTNVTDAADVKDPIVVNNTTSIVLAAANPERIFFHVSLGTALDNAGVFIKLQPASTDNDAKGITVGIVTMGAINVWDLEWEMPPDNIYTGEISAIGALTNTSDVNIFVTEY